MYGSSMQIQEDNQYPSSFEIQVDQPMNSSFVMDGDKIKFLNANLEVHQNGINRISDPKTQFNKIKIQPKFIKEQKFLGKGSAGEVYRAVYELNGKKYIFAVKSINATEFERRKQLLNDLRSYLSGGQSQYVIKFYTCFFHNGLVKQVIEYMDMGSLRNIIQLVSVKKIILPEEEMATIIYKILKGLQYIHEGRHQIHRDIKPQNIMLNSRGDVKIIDFGVSKCIQNSIGRTKNVGTVPYMSPQKLSLQGKPYTYKCDIWSVGLILFQLATGKTNYYVEGKFNYFKVYEKIVDGQPPQLPPNVYSFQMNDFLRKCLQKNEQQRQSAQGLLYHPWILSRAKANLRDLVEKIQSL